MLYLWKILCSNFGIIDCRSIGSNRCFTLALIFIELICANNAFSISEATTTTSISNGPGGGGGGGGGSAAAAISTGTILHPNCSIVSHIFEARGIKSTDIPKTFSNEIVLRYCELPSTGTCCSYNMESKLAAYSRQQLEKNLHDSMGKLSSILGTRASKFNDFFGQLLSNSKAEFHAMFKRTYGVIYEQNSYMFSDLFTELEKYYAHGKVDLSEAMDSFFNTLYQKMFTVLNAQYTFDDKYLGCVSDDMKEFKPFGDVPDKLSVQIKRSFVATRTFAQAVFTASEITKKISNIRISADCGAALAKMQQCGVCKGHTEKPCANYCVNVMKGCLQNLNELDTEWDNFVNSIEKLSERLLGPFNIVMVVEPINIKISEAIMNFQETGQDISKQVFRGCGRPSLGRKKRELSRIEMNNRNDILDIDAKIENEIIELNDRTKRSAKSNGEMKYDNGQFHLPQQQSTTNASKSKKRNKKKQKITDDDEYVDREPILDKLIKDIRQKVKDSKKFWSNLAYQICNNDEIASSPDIDRCWNGETIDRYKHQIAYEHGVNPEFPNNKVNAKTSAIISSQLYYLKTAVNHLRNAYNGLDVDWSDQEEPEYESGSGSGSGVDYDDEDRENGSGSHSFDIHENNHGSSEIDHTAINHGENDVISSKEIFTNSTKTKYSENERDHINNIHQPKENVSAKLKEISLRRALFIYLFPIYMAWFGGLFSDLL